MINYIIGMCSGESRVDSGRPMSLCIVYRDTTKSKAYESLCTIYLIGEEYSTTPEPGCRVRVGLSCCPCIKRGIL